MVRLLFCYTAVMPRCASGSHASHLVLSVRSVGELTRRRKLFTAISTACLHQPAHSNMRALEHPLSTERAALELLCPGLSRRRCLVFDCIAWVHKRVKDMKTNELGLRQDKLSMPTIGESAYSPV